MLINFYSTQATSSAAVLTYTIPKRSKLYEVRWRIAICTAGSQGFKWTLSLIPTDTTAINGAEGIISTALATAQAAGAGVYNTNFNDVFSKPIDFDAGTILYFHALSVVGAPTTSAVMYSQLILA